MLSRLDYGVDELTRALGSLVPHCFAIVDYVVDAAAEGPYAQAALEPSGWYVEAVSDWYLPREVWPIDEMALRRAGWWPPVEAADNWYRYEDAHLDVRVLAILLMDALLDGRRCDGRGEFRVTTGRFPSGPHGGEPLPQPRLAAAA